MSQIPMLVPNPQWGHSRGGTFARELRRAEQVVKHGISVLKINLIPLEVCPSVTMRDHPYFLDMGEHFTVPDQWRTAGTLT